MTDVRDWLNSIGFGQYAEAFAENAIEWDLLPRLDQEILKDIGIKAAGHRIRILDAAKQIGGAPPDEKPVAVSGAERRQLTVMFCDLVGSTKLSERLDPEDLRDVIRAYQDATAGAIARYDGYIARYVGDGLLVYFGFPRAHEDDPERSVRAGLGILESIQKLPKQRDYALEVRIGIATGRVVVGDIVGEAASQEQTVVGETPNLAARLQGVASPNSIVISERTHNLLGTHFERRSMGRQSLKGFSRPIEAWRVTGEHVVESRFESTHPGKLSALVGREQEVELLLERWKKAKGGEGQTVLLGGEPGIGKSRIIETIRERVRKDGHFWIQYQCSPHHVNTALYPAIRYLEFAAGFQPNDSAERKLARLESLLERPAASSDAIPLIAALLSVSHGERYSLPVMAPQEIKKRTLGALAGIVEELSRDAPVLFVLEDAHWIDPTTLELMDLIVGRIAQLRALVVLTHRPEFLSPWSGYAHCSALTLNHLGREQCRRLVVDLVRDDALTPATIEQIVDKTDGIPLYVEELTKSILETVPRSGNSEDGSGTQLAPSLEIPATLQDSLMARLDRLESGKSVAQIAGVIGREFGGELLSSVSDIAQRELDAGLGELIQASLIFPIGRGGVERYTFKHALVRDGAYESLLRSRRQLLHGRAAEALARAPNRSTDVDPVEIALHYVAAGQDEASVPFWHRAGQRAAERAATTEAVAHFRAGVAALGRLTETPPRLQEEADLRLQLGVAEFWAGQAGTEAFEENYVRARSCCVSLGDKQRLFPATWGLWFSRLFETQYDSADELSSELLGLARASGDAAMLLQAHHAAWTIRLWRGAPSEALVHAEAGIKIYDPQLHSGQSYIYGGHDAGVCARSLGGMSAWLAGYPNRATCLSREAIEFSERLDSIPSRMQSRWVGAAVSQFSGDVGKCAELASQCVEFGVDHGMGDNLMVVGPEIMRCWAAVRQSESGEAFSQMRDALELPGANLFRPYYTYLFADAQNSLGMREAALKTLEDALSHVVDVGESWWESEIRRFIGELVLRGGDAEAAEESFGKAMEVASEQQARALELRAACALANLRGRSGYRSEAIDILAPVLAWFTEGFDTADVIEANNLLEQLQ